MAIYCICNFDLKILCISISVAIILLLCLLLDFGTKFTLQSNLSWINPSLLYQTKEHLPALKIVEDITAL